MAGTIDVARTLRTAVMAAAKLAETPSATRSPDQCAPWVSPDPHAMMPSPMKTPIMVNTMRRLTASPRNTRLKIAAKTGIEAMMKITLATLVHVTARTDPGAVAAIKTV